MSKRVEKIKEDLETFVSQSAEEVKNNPNVQKFLKEHTEREEKRKKGIEDCTKELTAVLKKYYGDLPNKRNGCDKTAPLDTIYAPEVLARIMHLFDVGDSGAENLYLEWMVDRFVRIEVKRFLPWIEEIYKILKERSYTKDNQFEYNDLDCHVFFIP
ncbi:unnamed protein product, partial [marine sediment metagenome]